MKTMSRFQVVSQVFVICCSVCIMSLANAAEPEIPMPTVQTDAATSITEGNATLNGTVNPNGYDTAVGFEYGTTIEYGTPVAVDQVDLVGTEPQAITWNITGLSNNTLYHYRAVATNGGGTSYGNDQIFIVGTVGSPPSATTSAATAVSTTGARLNGLVNANSVDSAVTFEYGLTTGYGMTGTANESPVTGLSPAAVSLDITELSLETLYHFRVVATSYNGTDYGADMTFITAKPPPTVTTGTAIGIGSTAASLLGTVNPHGAVVVVSFEYGLSTSYESRIAALQSIVSGTTPAPAIAFLSGLSPETTYHYRIVGMAGAEPYYGSDMSFTTAPTGGPFVVTLKATERTPDSARLNGRVNGNGLSTNVTFQYGTDLNFFDGTAAVPSVVDGSDEAPVYLDISGLTPGQIYYFRVVARSSDGVTNYGNVQSFVAKKHFPWPFFMQVFKEVEK